MAMHPPTPETVIFRPFVWYLTVVLAAGQIAIGVSFVVWAPFRYSPIFQPARALTGGISKDLHIHSLDLWGIALIVAGVALPTIFTRRWWPIGWAGSILALVVGLFFTITLFEAVDTPPGHEVVPTAVQVPDHPGLLAAELFILMTLVLAGIVFATFQEHKRRRVV